MRAQPCSYQLSLSRRRGLRDINPPELRLLNLFLKIKILNYVQNFRQDNEEAFFKFDNLEKLLFQRVTSCLQISPII